MFSKRTFQAKFSMYICGACFIIFSHKYVPKCKSQHLEEKASSSNLEPLPCRYEPDKSTPPRNSSYCWPISGCHAPGRARFMNRHQSIEKQPMYIFRHYLKSYIFVLVAFPLLLSQKVINWSIFLRTWSLLLPLHPALRWSWDRWLCGQSESGMSYLCQPQVEIDITGYSFASQRSSSRESGTIIHPFEGNFTSAQW